MTPLRQGSAVVATVRRRARCQELWAVLDAAGVDAEIVGHGRHHSLVVRSEDLARAVAELDDYRKEAAAARPEPTPVARGGGWAAALIYTATLVAVAGLVSRNAFGADWFAAGRAQAGMMVGGEWWRAATALTLHLDGRHLLGNAAFGCVFGLLASQRLGGGVAWLVILAGGVLGNVANAILQKPEHSAVGASTAVFAGLGALIALAMVRRRVARLGPFRRWSPVVAGIMLLAWTGMGGERTDVLAHVTGLVAGAGVGAASALLPSELLDSRAVQLLSAALALGTLALAWTFALA